MDFAFMFQDFTSIMMRSEFRITSPAYKMKLSVDTENDFLDTFSVRQLQAKFEFCARV